MGGPQSELGNGARAASGTALWGAHEEPQGLAVMCKVLRAWLCFYYTLPKQEKCFKITQVQALTPGVEITFPPCHGAQHVPDLSC